MKYQLTCPKCKHEFAYDSDYYEKNIMMFRIFKDFVREEIGEEAYRRLIEKSQAELEAYEISGLMRHEYTRANYKTSVTSINKL